MHSSDSDILSAANERLETAIESLYEVFRVYSKPPFESCLDGLDEPTEKRRKSWEKELREYNPNDLGYFAHHSLLVGHDVISTKFFKYWLPRLLDDFSNGRSGGCVTDDWFLSDYLSKFDWMNWAEPESAAIRNWCFSLVEAFLFGREGSMNILSTGDSVKFAMEIGLDVTPLLKKSLDNMRTSVMLGIYDVIEEFGPDVIRRDKLDNDDNNKSQSLRIALRWMLHRTTARQLEKVFFKYCDRDIQIATLASESLNWINTIRNAYASDPRGLPEWLRDVQM